MPNRGSRKQPLPFGKGNVFFIRGDVIFFNDETFTKGYDTNEITVCCFVVLAMT